MRWHSALFSSFLSLSLNLLSKLHVREVILYASLEHYRTFLLFSHLVALGVNLTKHWIVSSKNNFSLNTDVLASRNCRRLTLDLHGLTIIMNSYSFILLYYEHARNITDLYFLIILTLTTLNLICHE